MIKVAKTLVGVHTHTHTHTHTGDLKKNKITINIEDSFKNHVK